MPARSPRQEGGSVTWLGPQDYDNLGVDAAELIRQAISQGADAIVGPDWVPQAMDPAFEEVVKHKIPLIIYNAGTVQTAEQLGAMNYIGSDPYQSGLAGGEYFASHSLKNAVCPQHAARCGQRRGLLQGDDGRCGERAAARARSCRLRPHRSARLRRLHRRSRVISSGTPRSMRCLRSGNVRLYLGDQRDYAGRQKRPSSGLRHEHR